MKTFYLFIIAALLSSTTLLSQTTYDIEVGGGPSGPSPYYSPQFITIEVGDIVRWTNSGGTHNVDGTLSTFPSNPEGFTSGQPSSSSWIFEWTFTEPGFYEFECSAFNHNETQFGNITVTEVSVGLTDYSDILLDIYPNPSQEYINVSAEVEIIGLTVYTLEMKKVLNFDVSGLESFETIYISELNSGDYILEVRTVVGTAHRRFIKK